MLLRERKGKSPKSKPPKSKLPDLSSSETDQPEGAGEQLWRQTRATEHVVNGQFSRKQFPMPTGGAPKEEKWQTRGSKVVGRFCWLAWKVCFMCEHELAEVAARGLIVAP